MYGEEVTKLATSYYSIHSKHYENLNQHYYFKFRRSRLNNDHKLSVTSVKTAENIQIYIQESKLGCTLYVGLVIRVSVEQSKANLNRMIAEHRIPGTKDETAKRIKCSQPRRLLKY